MPTKPPPRPELPSPRRRYDDSKPEKLYGDLRAYMAAKRMSYVPAPSDFDYEYWNIKSALKRRGYFVACEEMGLQPDPSYYDDRWNLRDEIDTRFLEPQELAHQDDDEFVAELPSYEELKAVPVLYEAVWGIGGMSVIYPQDPRFGSKLNLAYYKSDSNLHEEVSIWLKKLRLKALPTYAQIESRNSLLPDVYLARGGYVKTAELLGLPTQATFLKDIKNLEWELKLIQIQQAIKEGEPIIEETGLPDFWSGFMPNETEIRKARRPDIHRAIENEHGGYYQVAKALFLSLGTRFWQNNPTLRAEMKRMAYLLNHPKIMPDKDELKEIGRPDLASAIDHNGGYKECAAFVRLEPKKRVKRVERALVAAQKETKAFLPYPFRRFDPKMAITFNKKDFAFEVPTDVKNGEPEQFGVWLVDGRATAGRLGRVRRRARSSYEWLYRHEGESTWLGTFEGRSLQDCLQRLLDRFSI